NYELWRVDPVTRQKLVIVPPSVPLIEPVEQTLTVPNGVWTLGVAPAKGWGDPLGLSLKVALGLLFSLLLAYPAKLLVELRAHRQRLEVLVEERTAGLRAAEEKFRGLVEQ